MLVVIFANVMQLRLCSTDWFPSKVSFAVSKLLGQVRNCRSIHDNDYIRGGKPEFQDSGVRSLREPYLCRGKNEFLFIMGWPKAFLNATISSYLNAEFQLGKVPVSSKVKTVKSERPASTVFWPKLRIEDKFMVDLCFRCWTRSLSFSAVDVFRGSCIPNWRTNISQQYSVLEVRISF